MAATKAHTIRDRRGDLLLAISLGFLINLFLGVPMPQLGPLIAGIVAGVIVKEGLLKGGLAGFFAGTLGGLASISLWLTTNLFSLPDALLPAAFQYTVAILTAEYAVLSLAGGIIGSIVAAEHWPRLQRFLKRRSRFSPPSHPMADGELEEQED